MRTLLLALALTLSAGATHAQQAKLRDFCAERPGKATPPCILDAGHLQLEAGLADAVIDRSHGGHQETYTLGATELRFGLTPRVEVEVAWAPVVAVHAQGAGHRTGVGDTVLGLRGALTDPDKDGLAISAQGFVTAPTATRGMGAGGWTGGVRLPVSAPLAKDTDFGLTPEIDVVRDADGHGAHLAWIGVAGLSHGFGRLTLGTELWGEVDDDPAGRVHQASADLTAALALGDDAQLDAGLNLGLTHATPDAEVYIGVARRF
ncbi:transporter [Phenylobacterium sp.]|uniref:transporter n=1 Tax=Phenylobacterium sp. TaxID=1871053 RepID=UPI0025E2CAD9|nr:transporter [Phenylobacterium sp.]